LARIVKVLSHAHGRNNVLWRNCSLILVYLLRILVQRYVVGVLRDHSLRVLGGNALRVLGCHAYCVCRWYCAVLIHLVVYLLHHHLLLLDVHLLVLHRLLLLHHLLRHHLLIHHLITLELHRIRVISVRCH